MDTFKNIFAKYKMKLATGVIILLALMNTVSYRTGQEVALRPPGTATSLVATATRTRGTPTPGSASATPTVGVTLLPSLTPTGVVTLLPTATPGGLVHDVTIWHPPMTVPGFEHHHGVDPNAYVATFGPVLADYLTAYGEISYPWHTADENSNYGYGHHTAYVWMFDEVPGGCALFNNGGQQDTASADCITHVLMQVHSDGTQKHLRKRFHSHYVFMMVCNQLTNGTAGTECGITATGGQVDYGVLETPYKAIWCPLPGVDPAVYTLSNPPNLDQPPYRTSKTETRGTAWWLDPAYLFLNQVDVNSISLVNQFWSGLRPNVSIAADYDLGNGQPYPGNMPNATLGVAWSSLDAWGIINPANCADPELDSFVDATGNSALNNTAFIIYSVYLYDHPPAPASGFTIYWTDRWGHLLPEPCLPANTDCVPFYVGAGTPDGMAILNRQVQAETSLIHDYEVPGGGVILPAPIDPPLFPVLP